MKWDKDFPEFDSYLEQWKYVKKHHPTSLDNILYDGTRDDRIKRNQKE